MAFRKRYTYVVYHIMVCGIMIGDYGLKWYHGRNLDACCAVVVT